MSSNYQQKKMMNALGPRRYRYKGQHRPQAVPRRHGTPLPAGQRAAVLRGYRL